MQLRRDMGLSLESDKIEVMVGDHCSAGFVAKIITRRIFHYINVAGLISIVLRRCKQLGMLAITFLEFM